MKQFGKLIVLTALTASAFTSCIKDQEYYDPAAQYQLEKPIIEEYAKTTLTNPVFDEETGIWYEILNPGESGSYTYTVKDTSNQKVTYTEARVKYEGKLVKTGVVFDKFEADTGAIMPIYLNFTTGQIGMIMSWNYVFIPTDIGGFNWDGIFTNGLQKGTKIRFVTPSTLGYYNRSDIPKIPANSPLDFTVEVLSLKNKMVKATAQ